MTQALKGRKLVLVGFTLFSMFFGAGNLIFPPDLGAKAGVNLWPAFLGLAISAVGLSVPVLNALYPVAIVLITLSFVPGLEQRRRVYPLCIGCTAVQSIAAALPLGPLSALANALPLAALGFGWVLPAVVGLLAGIFLSCTEE